jgi:uncharacterized repeat protein (TIGR03803 family)
MDKFNWGMRACGVLLLWTATAVAVPAQTFTTLHSFNGTDGEYPVAGLIQATSGNLYGTTQIGGANADGTVFKISTNGTLTTLHSFDGTDGANPYAGLAQAANGTFDGTTYEGGANNAGTVFKITATGTLTTLHNFDGSDGAFPTATLVRGNNGSFYGTTSSGGDGTVFNITQSGTLTTVQSFDGTNGSGPNGLIQAANGNFYGTTLYGGANNNTGCNNSGCGTVFKITPTGALTTLYSFCSQTNCPDGYAPEAALAQGTDGNFYGTTTQAGANGDGTVFKITPSGELATLHSFEGTDGGTPVAALVQGTDGNFYGTTKAGGANLGGTIFNITPSGTLRTLYNFCQQNSFPNCPDGAYPEAGLVQDTNGSFYGTTIWGGNGPCIIGRVTGCGTVFSLSMGLGPFVKTQPTSGAVGAAVTILGTKLTGATSVSFNGTAAVFILKSKFEITTTVPVGATTGTVQVVTPGGTLSSNVPFTVRP